jgi:hypothetical protein
MVFFRGEWFKEVTSHLGRVPAGSRKTGKLSGFETKMFSGDTVSGGHLGCRSFLNIFTGTSTS